MRFARRWPGGSHPVGSLILALCGFLALTLTQPASSEAQDAGPRFKLVEAGRATLEEVPKGNRASNAIGSLAYAPDGKTLAVGMRDPNVIVLLDPATLAVRDRLEGHQGLVLRLVFSPDGKTLASSALDGTARVWDLATKQVTSVHDLYKDQQIPGSKQVLGLAISPDGKQLYTGQRTRAFLHSTFAWDLKEGRLLEKRIDYIPSVECLRISPDGLTLATTSREDPSIRLWDLATSKQKALFEAKGAVVDQVVRNKNAIVDARAPYANDVEFTPDGKSLAAVFNDRTLRLFDAATLTEKYQVETEATVMFLYLTMAPDGATLATADNQRLQLRRTSDGAPIATIPDVGGRITRIQFAPDGRSIAVGGSAGFLRVYRLENEAR